jgi:hypothetical protein
LLAQVILTNRLRSSGEVNTEKDDHDQKLVEQSSVVSLKKQEEEQARAALEQRQKEYERAVEFRRQAMEMGQHGRKPDCSTTFHTLISTDRSPKLRSAQNLAQSLCLLAPQL